MPTNKPLNVVVILGTNRTGRESEKAARFIMDTIAKHDELAATLFDVRDFPVPAEGYGQALKEKEPFSRYRAAVVAADALVIVTPEYNHGYPGTLKALLDTALREYVHKAVGFVSVSRGRFGGARVIENLVPVVRELGLVASFADLNFPNIADQFDEDGNPTDAGYHERAEKFLRELTWMAQTLQWGRNHLESEFH